MAERGFYTLAFDPSFTGESFKFILNLERSNHFPF